MSRNARMLTPDPRSTRRAVQLGERLSAAILDFQRSFPDTKPAEIQQAMRLAWGHTLPPLRRRRTVLGAAIVAALLALTLGLFVLGA